LTAGVIAYLQRANLPVLRSTMPARPRPDRPRPCWRWAVIGLVAMALLTPLGLLASGTAFGENNAPSGAHSIGAYLTIAIVGTVAIAAIVLGTSVLVRRVRSAA